MKRNLRNILDLLSTKGPDILKKLLHKSLVALSIILLLLFLKSLDLKATNVFLEKVKSSINYEFKLVEDSKKIFSKGKDLLDDSKKVLEVFNLDNEPEYPAPIKGEIFKGYHKETNRGIDILSHGDTEPRAIAAGIVKDVILTNNKGYYVTVESEEIDHIYGYLSKSYFVIGDRVLEGDLIGYLGTNKDGQKYLRFEIIKDGQHVNPLKFIEFQ